MKSRLVGIILVSTILIAGCSENNPEQGAIGTSTGVCGPLPSNSDNLENLDVTYNRSQAGPAIEWGIEQGCFAKYGLNISGQEMDRVEAAAAIESGQLDVIYLSLSEAVLYFANGGLDLKIIAPVVGYSEEELSRAKNEPLFPGELLLQSALFVSGESNATTIQDLKGQKVAVNSLTGPAGSAFRELLIQSGLGPDDIEILEVPQELIQGTIERGEVVAGVITGSNATAAANSGLRILLYPGAYTFKAGPVAAWQTTATVVGEKKELLLDFQKAIYEINSLLMSGKYNDSWKEVLIEKFEFDAETAASAKMPNYWLTAVELSDLTHAVNSLVLLDQLETIPDVDSLLDF